MVVDPGCPGALPHRELLAARSVIASFAPSIPLNAAKRAWKQLRRRSRPLLAGSPRGLLVWCSPVRCYRLPGFIGDTYNGALGATEALVRSRATPSWPGARNSRHMWVAPRSSRIDAAIRRKRPPVLLQHSPAGPALHNAPRVLATRQRPVQQLFHRGGQRDIHCRRQQGPRVTASTCVSASAARLDADAACASPCARGSSANPGWADARQATACASCA
jgi:hypothetical protein